MKAIALPRALVVSVLSLAGCSSPSVEIHTPTPPEILHVYSYFAAYALRDTNGNGQPDPGDAPLQDATFIVTLPGGTEFGGQTDETGYAFISIPAAVEYPVLLRMEAPEGSALTAIEPGSITLSAPVGETIQFLFSGETK